jgi:stage III sporulation protein AD
VISGIGIVSAAFYIILKQYRPEFAFACGLCAGIIILVLSLSFFGEIIEHIKKLVLISGTDSEKYKILFRCFGICIITKIASETCKDCGQESVSSKIDFAGKTVILFSALPLVSEIIEIIENIIFL